MNLIKALWPSSVFFLNLFNLAAFGLCTWVSKKSAVSSPPSGEFFSSHPPAVFQWRWLLNVLSLDYIHHTEHAKAFLPAAPLYPHCPVLSCIIVTLRCHTVLLPPACQSRGKYSLYSCVTWACVGVCALDDFFSFGQARMQLQKWRNASSLVSMQIVNPHMHS